MSRKALIIRLLVVVLIVGGVAFTIYYWFFLKMVRVPTGSMMNTIIPGDHIVVQKSLGQIERGSIVLFQYPDNPEVANSSGYSPPKGERYLSRVVGLPGETIQLRGNIIYINDRPLDEVRVIAQDSGDVDPLIEISTEGSGAYRVFYSEQFKDPESEAPGNFGTKQPFRIPNDNYFLLGDNRDNSFDSRFRGPVPRELIWGEASIIYYSEAETPGSGVRSERLFKRVQ